MNGQVTFTDIAVCLPRTLCSPAGIARAFAARGCPASSPKTRGGNERQALPDSSTLFLPHLGQGNPCSPRLRVRPSHYLKMRARPRGTAYLSLGYILSPLPTGRA